MMKLIKKVLHYFIGHNFKVVYHAELGKLTMDCSCGEHEEIRQRAKVRNYVRPI